MQTLPEAPPSLWLDTCGAYSPNPPLRRDIAVDAAVIGGGFTGIATAHELKRAEPGLEVAVLEARAVGYGASGRNGSFAMTVVGLGWGNTALVRGRQFLRDAHQYMTRAVEHLDALIQRENLDCDRLRPGFLRTATTQAYVRRLNKELDLMRALGFDDIHWIDAEQVRRRVNSPRYLGAVWEPRLLLVHPAKLVRAEKALAERLGARVFENTPVLEITTTPRLRLQTPEGAVTADKIVFATNAYSHLFPPLRRKQVPAFTYMVATEPLGDEQLGPIGWHGSEGVEDARNLIHYYRLTPDRRLVMGGGPVGLTWASSLHADVNKRAWRHLQRHMRFLFPSLANARITHRWGGPFSVTTSLSPAIGCMGDGNAFYSLGCIGHGVSMSHLNACTLRDLLLERKSELSQGPFVNPRLIPWPPEPLRLLATGALRGYLQLEDRFHEHSLPQQAR